MPAPVVLTRRGLLMRVFLGAWLLALVASAIVRVAVAPAGEDEALQTPVGVERPEAVQGRPHVTHNPLSRTL